MTVHRTVKKIGGSLAVLIPKDLAVLKDPPFDDDQSVWDRPFRLQDMRGLSEDMERQDALVRRLRLALPLEQRMNVLVLPARRKRARRA